MIFRTSFIAAALAVPLVTMPVAVQAQAPTALPIETYGDLPAIESAEISPSGAYTAMLMTSGGERIVSVLDVAGKPVRQFAIGDAKVRNIEWVGDTAILLIRSETGNTGKRYGRRKQEWLRANVLPLAPAAPVVSVFADQQRIANAIIGYHGIRQVEGRWKGYFGGFRKGRASGKQAQILDGAPALYEVDLLTGDAQQVAYPSEYPNLRDWLPGPDGKVAAQMTVHAETGKWKLEADGRTIAEGEEANGSASLTGFGATGDSVIYAYFDQSEGTVKRFEVPLAGGASVRVYDELIDRYIIDPVTGRVMGAVTDDGEAKMASPERQAALARVIALYDGKHFDIQDYTPDLSTVLVRTSGSYDSGTFYRVDSATGERALLGLERPAIQGQAIGTVETFDYTAQDGLEIEAILTLPPQNILGREAKNLPVLVFPHGGPTAHDDPVFDWWAQAFASRGYAVLQPNFRGSTNRDATFRSAGDGEWGGKMLTDMSDGLAALAEAGIADPDRACIMGASYGGYAALAGVTVQNGIYRCAVAVNAVTDLRPMFRSELTGRRDIFTRGIERLVGENTDLDAISPYRLARRADAPVLVIHGRDDTRVPYSQGAGMADALKDAGKTVAFVTLEGEDHFLSNAETRKRMLAEAVAFVERHNPAQ